MWNLIKNLRVYTAIQVLGLEHWSKDSECCSGAGISGSVKAVEILVFLMFLHPALPASTTYAELAQ